MSHTVRALAPTDEAAWLRFAADIPAGEERFLKEDIRDLAILERHTATGCWLVALAGDDIAGAVAALPGTGWSQHVAELRLIVGASHRGAGLGRELARCGLRRALELGCTHVYVEVVAEQTALVGMFAKLGFQPEALLADFVRDGAGDPHDLMILTHHAEDNWSAMAGIGLAEAGA
jgi:RimJ/RimL family protein N-acetyltransferase